MNCIMTTNERHTIANWTLNIPAYGSESVSFQPPSTPEPKTEGEYILVFKGSIGNEQDAITGKKVLFGCEPAITIVNEDGTQAKDTMLRNQSNDYKVTGCIGTVEWSVSGTGGSITQDGVLTAGSTACGSLIVTATCSKCGTSDTQDVRVTSSGVWYPIESCYNPEVSCGEMESYWFVYTYIGKYRYRFEWHERSHHTEGACIFCFSGLVLPCGSDTVPCHYHDVGWGYWYNGFWTNGYWGYDHLEGWQKQEWMCP
ncbi:MAG: hypothetical protein HY805_09075 [Nitrospirae bacterium]|nr:hypothetical protein [Nitrospirota bacterium]